MTVMQLLKTIDEFDIWHHQMVCFVLLFVDMDYFELQKLGDDIDSTIGIWDSVWLENNANRPDLEKRGHLISASRMIRELLHFRDLVANKAGLDQHTPIGIMKDKLKDMGILV